jgi:D-arabinitol 2-dehydrogenase
MYLSVSRRQPSLSVPQLCSSQSKPQLDASSDIRTAQAPYNAAKAAVRHLAASLAVEWAHANIRVNVISPGYMLTALTRKILDENPELNKTWTSLIPVGKMGRPEDLMGAVTFLLSDAAGYVTGADLRVDGGYTCT